MSRQKSILVILIGIACLATAENESDGRPSTLSVGKPAPDFSLPRLDGEYFHLRDARDKEIVILDFWATWCGPCRMGMPVLSRIADEYSDQEVRLYAVNFREDPEEINNFLEEMDLDVTVLIDRSGDVNDLYGADSLPQTVIIDTEGVIRSVHVGITRDYLDKMRKEVESVISSR